MSKVDRLLDKCSTVNPLDGRVLVMPLRIRTFKGIGYDQEEVLDENGKPSITEDGVPEMAMVEVEQQTPYNHQQATVLKVASDEDRFKVGDNIVYINGSAKGFDLIKGVSVLRRYDIIASL